LEDEPVNEEPESDSTASPPAKSVGEPRQAPFADIEEGGAEHAPGDDSSRRLWPPRGRLGLWLLLLVPCAVIGIDLFFVARASRTGVVPPAPTDSSVAPPLAMARAKPALELAPSPAPTAMDAGGLAVFDDENPQPEREAPKPEERKHFSTVQEAAQRSCSTESVEGLSRQILEQTRCINPNAFAPLPARPNLVMGPQVLPYLEASARDRLLQVLDAHKSGTMTINSALRTVAQQYLVWRWSGSRRCGVQLATPPGESNHETGLALDIAEQAVWRPHLEARDFRWLGASDRVHFDYKGSNKAPTDRVLDVQAFQMLWNRNHPNDTIVANGRYNPATEQRLKKAPPDGFAIGPRCSKKLRGKSATAAKAAKSAQ
jgi:hypothetical protein